MTSGLRVCYANLVSRIKVKIVPDSRFIVTASTPTKVKDVENVLSMVPNVTEFALEPTINHCVERMMTNLSDVVAGDLVLADSGVLFKVPVPWKGTTLFLVTGFNLTKYEKEQASRGHSLFGLLTNVSNFDSSVYLVTLTVVLCLALTCWFDAIVWRQKVRMFNSLFKRPRRRDVSIGQTLSRRWSRKGCVPHLFSLTVLFISTPFRCMYKTTQVLTDPPDLITSYEDILRRNTSVHWTDLWADIAALLMPSGSNTHRKDLVHRFYAHAMANRYKGPKVNSTEGVINVLKQQTTLTFDNKLVLLGDDVYTERGLAISCTMTFKYGLHRYFKFHDPLQREQSTGFALRRRVNSPKLVANLRRVFEFAVVDIRETRLARYLYQDFKFNEASDAQYHRQRSLCYEQTLDFHQRESSFTSDLVFFSSIFTMMLGMSTVATGVLAVEIKLNL